jgi:hypothetical protein
LTSSVSQLVGIQDAFTQQLAHVSELIALAQQHLTLCAQRNGLESSNVFRNASSSGVLIDNVSQLCITHDLANLLPALRSCLLPIDHLVSCPTPSSLLQALGLDLPQYIDVSRLFVLLQEFNLPTSATAALVEQSPVINDSNDGTPRKFEAYSNRTKTSDQFSNHPWDSEKLVHWIKSLQPPASQRLISEFERRRISAPMFLCFELHIASAVLKIDQHCLLHLKRELLNTNTSP